MPSHAWFTRSSSGSLEIVRTTPTLFSRASRHKDKSSRSSRTSKTSTSGALPIRSTTAPAELASITSTLSEANVWLRPTM